ncbi:MAG: GTP-binding protein [Candidatus Accumulibacter sp.]|jgi:G3E family GTPase|nr:GTP-binding protein [Accumulibacter sp.]
MSGGRCPIDVITGFLGSGKTTLLGDALAKRPSDGTSVIVNEYGQAGLDHRLLRRVEERTTLLAGGCVCCNRRDDLIQELLAMLNAHQKGERPLDRVVIETTGLADPAPILFSILTHPVLAHHYFIETVVACLDSVNGNAQIAAYPEAVKQIVSADKIIITKTDIGDPEKIERLERRVASINPAARVLMAARGAAPPSMLAPVEGRAGASPATGARPARETEGVLSEGHVTDIKSLSVRFDAPLNWQAFGVWLSMLLQHNGEKIMRVKGIVDMGEAGPIVLNGVQHIIHPPKHLPDWRDYETCGSEIVFITRRIEPEKIMGSLIAFQRIIGASPEIREIDSSVFR